MKLEPKPIKVERAGFNEHCNCHRCLKDRLRASNKRCKGYLEVIERLRRLVIEYNYRQENMIEYVKKG